MINEAQLSPYLMAKIRTTAWEKRRQVNDLLLLFRLMNKQRLSPAEGQLYFLLRNNYEQDYLQLLKENDPLRYQVYLEEQEKMKQQQQVYKLKEKEQQQLFVEQERKEYQLWLSLQKRA